MRNAHTIAMSLTKNTDAFWTRDINIEQFRAVNLELWQEAEASGIAAEVRDLITTHYRAIRAERT